jgi:hypothetical protein
MKKLLRWLRSGTWVHPFPGSPWERDSWKPYEEDPEEATTSSVPLSHQRAKRWPQH